MASLIETLIDVLDKENTEYQGLLKLSEEKTTAIVNGNVERLQEILGLEQRSIDKINKLDAFRDENVGDICNVLNIPRKGIKIENIVDMLSGQPKDAKALTDVHMKLKRTLDQLMKVNENNKMLLQESMDMIEFELNLAIQRLHHRRVIIVKVHTSRIIHILRQEDLTPSSNGLI